MSDGQVCVANINATGRRRRMALGVVVLAGTFAAHIALVRGGNRLWVLAEVPLLFYGWLCVIQAVERTCVVLVAQGKQETAGGTEAVTDAALTEALRRKAQGVYVKSLLATLAFAAAMFFLGM